MLEEVTMKEMNAIFAVTDAMGLSREALVIPLLPRSPGRVRKMPNGKLEIVVDREDFDGFVAALEGHIKAAGGA